MLIAGGSSGRLRGNFSEDASGILELRYCVCTQLPPDSDVDASKTSWVALTDPVFDLGIEDMDPRILEFHSLTHLFSNCKKLERVTDFFDTSEITDMSCMFYSCYILKEVDLSNLDTSRVTNMSNMFSGCFKLTSLDLSKFDTRRVKSGALTSQGGMVGMFGNCKSLTELDLSSFTTGRVTSFSLMFYGCEALTKVNLSSFDTSAIQTMDNMFYDCRSLELLDLSNFDTSSVTSVMSMFQGCKSLKRLDLFNFNCAQVTGVNMNSMFDDCNSLSYIKCRQSFKDWCWTNADAICLPTQMRSGGTGTWEIVK